MGSPPETPKSPAWYLILFWLQALFSDGQEAKKHKSNSEAVVKVTLEMEIYKHSQNVWLFVERKRVMGSKIPNPWGSKNGTEISTFSTFIIMAGV